MGVERQATSMQEDASHYQQQQRPQQQLQLVRIRFDRYALYRVIVAFSYCANFNVTSNYDYAGNDITSGSGYSLSGCCSWCSNTSGCLAFALVLSGNTCYLKSSTGSGGGVASNIIAGSRYAITASECCLSHRSILRCFDLDLSTCATYTVTSNLDYPGNDIMSASGFTLAGCCSWCSSTSGCMAFSLVASGTTCYLKTTIGSGGTGASGITSGRR